MSLFQFSAAVQGWMAANGDGKPEPLSGDAFDKMVERSAKGAGG
ncbi:hypothetical protein ACLBXM_17980 [Xanthobacteraceae bacterium A53D]